MLAVDISHKRTRDDPPCFWTCVDVTLAYWRFLRDFPDTDRASGASLRLAAIGDGEWSRQNRAVAMSDIRKSDSWWFASNIGATLPGLILALWSSC